MAPVPSITNARIWTAWEEAPWASSLSLEAGHVLALDPPEPGSRALDVGGRFVVPGLIDAHVHLLLGGLSLSRLDLSTVLSRAAFESAIATRHAELPPDRWLIAVGWSEESWGGREPPDKSWLTAAGDRPVVCYRVDLHAALVNDAVLRRCDLSTTRRDEAWGGRVVRDDGGEPTGLMVEAAAWEIVNPLVPAESRRERRSALLAAQAHVHRHGITAAGSMEYGREVEEVFAPLRERLTLRTRITLLDRAWPMSFERGRAFPGDDALAVIGYKAFIDGTLGSRTARMLEDYADEPGNRGLLVEFAAEGHLRAWAAGVVASGLSPSMHAIGDAAVRLALDVVEKIRPASDGGPAPRVEHVQHVAPEDIERFAGGVIASMQPLHKADDGRFARRRLGDERLAGTFAFRRLLDAGARLAFGSDWPVVSCAPLAGIRAAVTGLTTDDRVFLPEQNLTIEEALRAYTTGAAEALGLSHAGSIRPGGWADLVVLDRDPFAADWVRDPPRVDMTIVGGEVVFNRQQEQRRRDG